MLIMLRFLETALDTSKIRDKCWEILREMRKRMLLKMLITYKKKIKAFADMLSRQNFTYLSCQV